MTKQTINIGTIQNDGTGSTLRDAGDLINDNFNEIYTAIGDGTTLNSDVLTATSTHTLTNKTFNANGTGNSITNIEVADFASGVVDTNISSVSSSDDTLASAKAIKTYIDSLSLGLSNVVDDTTPQLGGNLDLNSNDVTGTGNINISGNITASGNLTINGTTTTLNTTNTTVTDNLLELNSGVSSNANDSGIIIERGSTGNNAIMAWDESADKFIFGTTTATASDTGNLTITAGTIVANLEGNVTGNATTATSATTATTLATGRTIGMTGDVVWTSASFDGSGNVTGTASIQANTITSSELSGAVRLDILNSSGTIVKTLFGSGS